MVREALQAKTASENYRAKLLKRPQLIYYFYSCDEVLKFEDSPKVSDLVEIKSDSYELDA